MRRPDDGPPSRQHDAAGVLTRLAPFDPLADRVIDARRAEALAALGRRDPAPAETAPAEIAPGAR